MSTIIKFKRGSSLDVNNYTDAVAGEPVFDYESGRLFMSVGAGEDLVPVDQQVYLQGYEGFEEVSYGSIDGVVLSAGEPSTDTDLPPGSMQIDSTTGLSYILISNPVDGDAVWSAINTISFSSTVPSTDNYPVGSMYVDETTGIVYIKTSGDGTDSVWKTVVDEDLNSVGSYTTNSAPSASDQAEVGTLWVNSDTGIYYVCTDNTEGAAVWATNQAGSVTDTAAPTSASDGYNIGSVWVDTVSGIYYVCTDNTEGAAVWVSSASSPTGVTTSTSDPTISDDSHAVGVIWVNTTTNEYFVCTDAASGAAVWVSTTSSPDGVHTTTSDPTVSDDGHAVGVIWVNTTSNDAFVCTDAASGAAVWVAIGNVDNILPTQTGNSGKYLTTNGTAASWGTISASSLPTQTGNSGKFLTTDGSTASWAEISGGGSPYIDKRPDEMELDDTDLGVIYGSAFSLFKTVDFSASVDGSIWFSFEIPSHFDTTADITMRLVYSLSGADSSKNVILTTRYWAVGASETPNIAAPAQTDQDTISSSTTQGIKKKVVLTGAVINASDIADQDTVIVKMTRDADNVLDTYSGTFQLIAVELYQA